MCLHHTLAVLGVASAVVEVVPVESVGATLAWVTAVARLPVLEAVGSIVKVFLALVNRALHSILNKCRHFVLCWVGKLHNVECVGEESWDVCLLCIECHIAGPITL